MKSCVPLLVGFVLLVANVYAQSLGEIAAKEKERRKKNAEQGVKVKELKVNGEPTPASGEPTGANGQATDPSAADSDAKTVSPSSGGGTAQAAKKSSMDEMKDKAVALEPKMAEISGQADVLDNEFRRYIDGCYRKYMTANTVGTGVGYGTASSAGAALGRDWFAVWESQSTLQWSESWTQQTVVSNEDTAQCRMLWSDIVARSASVQRDMQAVQEKARRQGVLPGHLRDLRQKYRLDWRGWDN